MHWYFHVLASGMSWWQTKQYGNKLSIASIPFSEKNLSFAFCIVFSCFWCNATKSFWCFSLSVLILAAPFAHNDCTAFHPCFASFWFLTELFFFGAHVLLETFRFFLRIVVTFPSNLRFLSRITAKERVLSLKIIDIVRAFYQEE